MHSAVAPYDPLSTNRTVPNFLPTAAARCERQPLQTSGELGRRAVGGQERLFPEHIDGPNVAT